MVRLFFHFVLIKLFQNSDYNEINWLKGSVIWNFLKRPFYWGILSICVDNDYPNQLFRVVLS